MRLLFWVYRRAIRVRQFLRRTFTLAGGFVLAGLLMVSMLASNPGEAVAYQGWALLLVLLGVSLAFAPFFRIQVVLTRVLPRFGTAGEPLHYRVTLVSQSRRNKVDLEFGEVFGTGELDFEAFKERLRPGRRNRTFQLSAPLYLPEVARVRVRPVPVLPAGGTVEVRAEVTPLRRGPLHFARAWLGRRDPLGLVRAIRTYPLPGSVMILPRRYPVSMGRLPGVTQYQHGGVTFASGVGESEEFVGVREYRQGDSLRRLHWRATARIGRPVVREYQDEFFVRHGLVLDTFCDPSVDQVFEDAVSVAASFACTVPEQDSLLDLLFVGPRTVCITAGRGVGHSEHMLEVLACVRPCRASKFTELEDLVVQHASRMSGCLLVLIEWDAARRRLVGKLRALRIPVWALVVVPPGSDIVWTTGSPLEMPDRLIVLESGRIGEGMRDL